MRGIQVLPNVHICRRIVVKVCDCGAQLPKDYRRKEGACSECLFQDGENKNQKEIISALRAMGGAANRAAIEMETGISQREVWRTTRILERKGRIVRYLVEGHYHASGQREGHDITIFALTDARPKHEKKGA